MFSLYFGSFLGMYQVEACGFGLETWISFSIFLLFCSYVVSRLLMWTFILIYHQIMPNRQKNCSNIPYPGYNYFIGVTRCSIFSIT